MQVENVSIYVDEIYTTVILCLQNHICLGNESQSMNVEYVAIEMKMKIYTTSSYFCYPLSSKTHHFTLANCHSLSGSSGN